MEPASSNCSIQPSIIFLMVTLIITTAATAVLCTAIMTEHWEYVVWDKEKLKQLEKDVIVNKSHMINLYKLEWLLDGQVARVILDFKNSTNQTSVKKFIGSAEIDIPALFFAPMRGGIWTYCFMIYGDHYQTLINYGFPAATCKNYLKQETKGGNSKASWQHKMQNLSISCALVCLIILGSSALLGTIGVTKRQISAVLITGVMYILAGIFAIFSLTIINFKRAQSKMECYNGTTTQGLLAEGIAVSTIALEKPYSLKRVNKYFSARVFSAGWSLHLGWGGAGMCILASVLWIFLSKIMRYNPLNILLTV